MSIPRKILVTAAAAVAAVAAGCGGHEEAADVASSPAVRQSSSTEQLDLHAATTTPAPLPITAAETAWRDDVSAYAERLDANLNRSMRITHASMRRSARLYSDCAPMLKRAGDPGRFEEVAPQVERACERLAKAARLLQQAIAASDVGGAVVVGTPEEQQFDRALNGAMEAAGNAQYDLQRALEKAAALEAELEA